MRTKEQNVQLIKELSNANGVSGFEGEVAGIAKRETESFCDVKIDSLRNTYINPKAIKAEYVKFGWMRTVMRWVILYRQLSRMEHFVFWPWEAAI